MEETVREVFARGEDLLESGNWQEALASFRDAHTREPGNASFRSYYGLCLGIVERRFQQSAELCHSAAKQEFFNPDLYLNLARLHLSFGFKAEGLRYLRRGRMIDPGHALIARELSQLGHRSPPMLRFLPRSHPLNRWLGAACHVLSRTGGRQAAA